MTRRVYAKLLFGRRGAATKSWFGVKFEFSSLDIDSENPCLSWSGREILICLRAKTLISVEVIYPVQTNLTLFLARTGLALGGRRQAYLIPENISSE